MYNEREYNKWEKKFKKFQKENKSSITKMVLDFERKKSADIAKKIKRKDTGIINERILHTYKWNDKLFKTKKMVPEGKKHGLIMLVDCSGSMQDYNKFESAVKQAMILVEFCRKAGIKYKVLGFSNGRCRKDDVEYRNNDSKKYLKMKNVPVLREWFSDEQNLQQHNFMSTYMLFKTKKFRYGPLSDGPNSGTPLIDSVLLLRQVALKFKKDNNITVLNTVTLTDGISCGSSLNEESDGTFWTPVSKVSSYDPLTKTVFRTSDLDNLENVLKYYKKVVGGNIIGFNITNGWFIKNQPIIFKENSEGYDHHYTFSFSNIFEKSSISKRNMEYGSNTMENLQENFRNFNISKNDEKILLTKFIDIIS